MAESAVSLSRYLARDGGGASPHEGRLAALILQMAFASKHLAREIRRAALVGKLGLVGEKNATGDAQKKLDVYANEVVVDAFEQTGLVAAVVSEELDELRSISGSDAAEYILCVDPLDGSSNADVNGAVGTIFSFHRRPTTGRCIAEEELRGGARQVAAGYVLYGPSTVLVYSDGVAVSGFTLDHDVGEFILSHDTMRCPQRGPYYGANLGRYNDWEPGVRDFADYVIERDPDTGRPYSLRYSGALAADFHRILLEGGIYFYPADAGHPTGKLRLLYECAPLAFVAEHAGGRASTGRRRILDIEPEALHQTVPFAVGSSKDVRLFEEFCAPDRR